MDAQKYIEMLRDKHFIDLKKMEYKYSKEDVSEMLKLLYANDGNQLPLTDTGNRPLLYINSMVADTSTAMKSLMRYFGKDDYSLTAIEDEIVSTLSIEQIDTSRESVRNILTGLAPQNEAENRIAGMKKGFEFIADKSNRITAESVRYLYEIMINPFLEDQNDRLSANQLYRTGAVHIVNQTRNINVHDGMAHTKLSYHMDELFSFIHTADAMNDLHKAAAIHYYFAYLHPYFDGNGRMARMLHLWYLLQQGYSASLFLPFSSIIQKTKQDYYKAFDYTEKNALISNRLDITPFLSYFADVVYQKMGNYSLQNHTLDAFQQLLDSGRITEKENELFQFVLSRYGMGEFSTKQLEKDFGNCAYATIRSFVLKLTKEGILEQHPYGNRNKYCIAAAKTPVKIDNGTR